MYNFWKPYFVHSTYTFLNIRHYILFFNFRPISKGFINAKFILYADSVYGMEHWGIGFGSRPFEIQGETCITLVSFNEFSIIYRLQNSKLLPNTK